MNPAIRKYLEAASSFTTMTTARAEKLVKQLVRSGEAAGDQMGELVDDLLERQKKNQEAIASLVKSETTRAVRAMGVASSEEVEHLQDQVAELKREVARLQGGTAPATKATATKVSGKKTARKTAKKAAGKKAAKKAAGKKTAKKAAGKKATTRAAKKASGTSTGSSNG